MFNKSFLTDARLNFKERECYESTSNINDILENKGWNTNLYTDIEEIQIINNLQNAKTDTTKRRMEIMTESTDGFYISEQDLKLRGSGELFGLKQSGDEGFVLANLYDDIKILRCAREEGKMLLESKDPNKVKLCRDIAYSLERWSKYICFN